MTQICGLICLLEGDTVPPPPYPPPCCSKGVGCESFRCAMGEHGLGGETFYWLGRGVSMAGVWRTAVHFMTIALGRGGKAVAH
jgi:hypothetical protein